MQITSIEEYKSFFEKYKKREIILSLATDFFLNYFWTSKTAGYTLKSMGISIKYKYIISIISSMRFITFLIACITTIFYFKWWAFLIVPILTIIFGLLLNVVAKERINLFLGVIVSIIGVLIALIYQEKGLWFQIMVFSISLDYFFIEFTQYITNTITTYLLLTNYNFFDFFQYQKGRFGYPFFYIEEGINKEKELSPD